MADIVKTFSKDYQTEAFAKTVTEKCLIRARYFEQRSHDKTQISQMEIDRVVQSIMMQSLSSDGTNLNEDEAMQASYPPGIFNAIVTVDSDDMEKLEMMFDGKPWLEQKAAIGKETFSKYLDTMSCKACTGILKYGDKKEFDLTFGNPIATVEYTLTINSTPKDVANYFQKMFKLKKLRSGKSKCEILAGTNFFAMLAAIEAKNPQNINIKTLEEEDGYNWYGWKVLNEQGEYTEADKEQTEKVVVDPDEALMMDTGYKHRILFCLIKVNGDSTQIKTEDSNAPLFMKPEIQGNGLATKIHFIGRPFPILNYRSISKLKKKAA